MKKENLYKILSGCFFVSTLFFMYVAYDKKNTVSQKALLINQQNRGFFDDIAWKFKKWSSPEEAELLEDIRKMETISKNDDDFIKRLGKKISMKSTELDECDKELDEWKKKKKQDLINRAKINALKNELIRKDASINKKRKQIKQFQSEEILYLKNKLKRQDKLLRENKKLLQSKTTGYKNKGISKYTFS